MDTHQLTREAHAQLVALLTERGNVLSDPHRAALYELVDTLSGYIGGTLSGRKAFPLPTGMGKTSAVACFVATLHRLGSTAAVSVSASKVEALCELKREFMALGVPEHLIGIKHALSDASLPSTGDESRIYQLVTHARVRSGKDLELFGSHAGNPRALMVYDETLFTSDAVCVDMYPAAVALAAVGVNADRSVNGSTIRAAHAYLKKSIETIEDTLCRLRTLPREDSDRDRGLPVNLGELHPATLDSYITAVQGAKYVPITYSEQLEDLLRISQDPIRAIATSQNGGIVWSKGAVPDALRNVVVLDASQPIRDLARMDPTIELVHSFDRDPLKTYEDLKVVQLVAGGGRDSIEKSLTKFNRERSALSAEVIEIVAEHWESAKGILIFSFKPRSINVLETLKRDLRAAGYDPRATGPDGRPKLNWLTWGEETSLNGYEHCDVVIMAGVLQRSYLDIAARIKGQKADPEYATTNALVRNTVESEVAHVIYQGASRGACRRVTEGKAAHMTLYFVHRNVGIRELLGKVLPGAKWETRDPKHLKKGKAAGVVRDLVGRILEHLRELPEEVKKVSSRELKGRMQLPQDVATEHAFKRAVEEIGNTHGIGWAREGRSIVRTDAKWYGFA